MEKSLSLLQKIRERFACGEVDIRTYSPLTLAFIGDSIYDLVIRTVLVERGNRATSGLHKSKSRAVCAGAQAAMIDALMEQLSEEEQGIYRRGRNAKSYTTAKNASVGDYRKATGFEALLGYLYLTDQTERLLELVQKGLALVEIEV